MVPPRGAGGAGVAGARGRGRGSSKSPANSQPSSRNQTPSGPNTRNSTPAPTERSRGRPGTSIFPPNTQQNLLASHPGDEEYIDTSHVHDSSDEDDGQARNPSGTGTPAVMVSPIKKRRAVDSIAKWSDERVWDMEDEDIIGEW